MSSRVYRVAFIVPGSFSNPLNSAVVRGAHCRPTMSSPAMARVGVAVFLIQKETGQILLGHRLSKHGRNTLGLPGGYLEYQEEFEECAMREVREETGICIDKHEVQVVDVINTVFPKSESEGRPAPHSVTVFTAVSYDEGKHGDPKVMEPDKCKEWIWISWEDLSARDDLFLPLERFVQKRKLSNPFGNDCIGCSC